MVALTEIQGGAGSALESRAARLIRALTAAVAGGLIYPAVALAGSPVHASLLTAVSTLLLTLAVAGVVRFFAGSGVVVRVAGCFTIAASGFLISAATYPGSGFVVAALLGVGAGPFVPSWRTVTRTAIAAALGAAGVIALLTWRLGSGPAGIVLLLLAIAVTAAAVFVRPAPLESRRHAVSFSSFCLLYGAFASFWVGTTSPSVEWFGSLTSHGPRDRSQVAITFDDGPDANFTLPIATILEQYGVRGTFFEVGKAIVRNPQITQELMDRGHVVGNHSYNHGAFSYLDPGYPELAHTENVFRDQLRRCPALFRPPHGTHTPFMSRTVDRAGMTLVTWDVSAKDWVETDAVALAKHILEKVRRGSIILLHDSIDGEPGANRSVVVQALPAILEGLKAKGLEPVTLDKLLGTPAYLNGCG